MRSGASYTEWLLFHLWKTDEVRHASCPHILIPDTVIYRWGRPYLWYFSTRSGQLLRKSKTKLSSKCILSSFTSSQQPSQLVAAYLSFEAQTLAVAHYFTLTSFSTSHTGDFVMNREKSLSGLLQRWIEPKGGHASRLYIALIKASWSSSFTIVERRVNVHPLNDKETDFYDRIATYEGLEAQSRAEAVTTPQIVGDVQKICEGMVQHVRKVSGGNVEITRMVVYFKQDERDQLWLLFCGGVQILDLEEERSKGPEKELELSLPPIALSKHMPAGGEYHEMAANRLPCFSCNLLTRQESLYPLSFRLVLSCLDSGFDSPPNCSALPAETELEISEERADEVPGVIRRAVVGVTNEKYSVLRGNMKWLQSPLKLCESCYLYYTAHVLKETHPTKPLLQRPVISPAPVSQPLPVSPPLRTASSWSFKRTTTSSKLLLSTSRSRKQPEIAPLPTPRLQGHFTAKRLPSLLSIYSLSETSTQSGSQSVRVRTMPKELKSDVVKSTIQQLKMCILDGI